MVVSLSIQDDKKLMELVKTGDHQAFNTLVRQYGEYFYRISYRYVCNKENAQDIVQQAFLKLWEFPYKYNPNVASFKVWFCRVVVNLSIDFLRKKKITVPIDNYEIEDDKEKVEEGMHSKAQEEKVEKAIAMLPLRQKSALNLIVYEDLSYEEAAAVMKLKAGAVKSLVVRAKENLKKYLKGEGNV